MAASTRRDQTGPARRSRQATQGTPRGARTQGPTLADIAKLAGVSKVSVACALNGRPGVSEETRARIQAIAQELGWKPSPDGHRGKRSRADVTTRQAEGEWLTASEIMAELRIAPRTWQRWRTLNRTPEMIRLPNGEFRIHRDDYQAWLDGLQVDA
jgi:transcriptional regulator with XRE-family HTH domain